MSRLLYFLRSNLTDGGEFVRLKLRLPLTPRNIPGTHFCEKLRGHYSRVTAERIGSIAKSSDLNVNQTRGLQACSIVPQQTKLQLALRIRCKLSFVYI
jgi:hypothetical protein